MRELLIAVMVCAAAVCAAGDKRAEVHGNKVVEKVKKEKKKKEGRSFPVMFVTPAMKGKDKDKGKK